MHNAYTYAAGPVNSDPYYHENLVMSDLPAGIYKLLMKYKENDKSRDVQFFFEIFLFNSIG